MDPHMFDDTIKGCCALVVILVIVACFIGFAAGRWGCAHIELHSPITVH